MVKSGAWAGPAPGAGRDDAGPAPPVWNALICGGETELVEHRTIEYVIRQRLGPDEWIWTIYPKNAATVSGEFTGTRVAAFNAARRGIDRWIDSHGAQEA
jgi:hypothetical protein